MLFRTIPKTGDSVSILGFGCMRLPEKGGKIDEERATEMIRHAIDKGVNYLDTAWPYHNGQSEAFVGRALSGGYRERVKIATKLPQWLVKNREDMDTFLNAQLKNLRTDHIEYYLVHSVGKAAWERLKELGIREFLDTAKADGRIGNAGFSYHEDSSGFKKIVDDYPWEFCQIQYNILDEYNQAGREGLKYAAEKGLAVIIMEPLRGGKLAANPPDEVKSIYAQAEVKRSYAEWALLWLWDQPEVTIVLSGMSTESQVEENLKTASDARPGCLIDKEREIISSVAGAYRKLMKVPCTGCQYCMPCPAGVNIPACFEMYNNYHMFDDKTFTKAMYGIRLGGILGTKSNASQCIRCGMCLKACPQHIAIPDRLSEVSGVFEGLMFHILTLGAPLLMPVMRRMALLRRNRG